jgi:3-oxoacyl-(acyl-carrier-protein) synthase
VAAFLGVDGPVTTLIGESSAIIEGVSMAHTWLTQNLVDRVLVIGAEECDWVGAEAVTYYHPDLKATEGAAALLLSLGDTGLKLSHTPAFAFLSESERAEKLAQIARNTGFSRKEVRVSGESGIAMLDEAESSAMAMLAEGEQRQDYRPRSILGESMGAGGALQLVLAAETARLKGCKVQVTLPGSLCAAYGASLEPEE